MLHVLEILWTIVELILTVIFHWNFLICLGVTLLLGLGLKAFFPEANWLLEASIVVGIVAGLYWELKTKKN